MDDLRDWRDVAPVSPAAGWIGGKKQLAKRLCALIEATPHRVYAEPFVGMGGVFLRRRRAARAEAINDADRDVANFFRILQRHYQQFMDTLKWQVASRADFERLADQPPELLTDLERAARFLYLQKLAFGGKVRGHSFAIEYRANTVKDGWDGAVAFTRRNLSGDGTGRHAGAASNANGSHSRSSSQKTPIRYQPSVLHSRWRPPRKR